VSRAPLGAASVDENICITDHDHPDVYDGLTRYFELYNDERLHHSLDYETPARFTSRGAAA